MNPQEGKALPFSVMPKGMVELENHLIIIVVVDSDENLQ